MAVTQELHAETERVIRHAMRILAVSDEENNTLWGAQVRELTRGTDLIISCGDLRREYLEYLLTMINAPLLYVYGNHDTTGPEGGLCIDGKICVFCGVKFLGLGGCMRYRDSANMYTEAEMRRRLRRLRLSLWLKGGIDVLVTHAPAKGWGDLEDIAHSGFETFGGIMTQYRPKLMLHGHVHMSYGRIKREYVHTSGTRIMNVCGYKIVDI